MTTKLVQCNTEIFPSGRSVSLRFWRGRVLKTSRASAWHTDKFPCLEASQLGAVLGIHPASTCPVI
jgi:hypothetical protein